MSRFSKLLLIVGGLWTFGLVLALMNSWPWTGRREDWFWFLLLAPPAALLLQAVGELHAEWWQRTRLARAVQQRARGKRFSWLRILLALVGVGVVTVVVGGVAVWIR